MNTYNEMKRNLVIILIIIIAAAAGYIYITKNEVVFSKETSLYKAVAISTPVFVEFNSLKSIPKENQILNELSGIEDFSWLIKKIDVTQSAILGDKEIQNHFSRTPFIIAFDFIGKNVIKPLIISELRSSE